MRIVKYLKEQKFSILKKTDFKMKKVIQKFTDFLKSNLQ